MSKVFKFSSDTANAPEEALGAFSRGAGIWLRCGKASAGLWWENVPSHEAGKVGTIGAWVPGPSVESQALLVEAMAELATRGCGIALAPMDGNTWRRYRFVTWSNGRPPFFLEPFSQTDAIDDFLSCGFTIYERYSSGVVDLTRPGPDLRAIRGKLEAKGVAFAPLPGEAFSSALREIYEMSLASFARNVYYTPLDWESFASIYMPLRPLILDGLVWTARDASGLAAYLFAVPDRLDTKGKAVILKTLAARPDPALAGVGSVLTGLVQETAAAMGFTAAIHALEHESNQSQRLSRRFGTEIFRHYALLGRRLAR